MGNNYFFFFRLSHHLEIDFKILKDIIYLMGFFLIYRTSFVLQILIFISTWGFWAQSEDAETVPCSELINPVQLCNSGTYSDPSGNFHLKSREQVSREFNEKIKKYNEIAKDKFRKLFDEPDQTYLMQLSSSKALAANCPTSYEDGRPIYISSYCKDQFAKNAADTLIISITGDIISFLFRAFESIVVNITANQGRRDFPNLILLKKNHRFLKIQNEILELIKSDLSETDRFQVADQKVLPQVKSDLLALIDNSSIKQADKEVIKIKLQQIESELLSCSNLGINKSIEEKNIDVEDYFKRNAFYLPLSNGIGICNGMLRENSSEFLLSYMLAHEIAHSFDPCTIQAGPEESNQARYKKLNTQYDSDNQGPFKDLIQCLRSEGSIEAKTKTKDSSVLLDGRGNQIKDKAKIIRTKSGDDFSYCFNDQIGESFSDYFATEAIAKYMDKNPKWSVTQFRNGMKNIARIFVCRLSGNPSKEFDVHPEWKDRIVKILMAHPQIQKKLNCIADKPEVKYCDSLKFSKSSGTPGPVLPPLSLPPSPAVK